MRIQYIYIFIISFLFQSCFDDKNDELPLQFAYGGFVQSSTTINEEGEEVAMVTFVSGISFDKDITINYSVSISDGALPAENGLDYSNSGSFVLPAGSLKVDVNLLNALDNDIPLGDRMVVVSLEESSDLNFGVLDGIENATVFAEVDVTILEDDGTLLATSFEDVATVSGEYETNGTADLPNISGQPTVDFEGSENEIGFDLSYVVGEEGGADELFLGVTSDFDFPDGDQGYVFTDADGVFELVFDPISIPTDVSNLDVELQFEVFFNGTWEGGDFIEVYWSANGTLGDPLLALSGDDDTREVIFNGNNIIGEWTTINLTIPQERWGDGNLVIRCSNSASSEIFAMDNFIMTGFIVP